MFVFRSRERWRYWVARHCVSWGARLPACQTWLFRVTAVRPALRRLSPGPMWEAFFVILQVVIFVGEGWQTCGSRQGCCIWWGRDKRLPIRLSPSSIWGPSHWVFCRLHRWYFRSSLSLPASLSVSLDLFLAYDVVSHKGDVVFVKSKLEDIGTSAWMKIKHPSLPSVFKRLTKETCWQTIYSGISLRRAWGDHSKLLVLQLRLGITNFDVTKYPV